MDPGQGNSIVEPQMDPSRPIANWQGSTPTAQQGQGKFARTGLGKLLSRFGMSKYGMDRSTPEMTSQIWQYLKSKGLSNVAAAGILGNFQAESNMYSDRLQNHDPSNGSMDITVDNATGYGLAQWTNSSRQQALKDYAASVGQQAGDWKTQIDFMLSGKDGDIGPLIQAMDASGDPAKAALLFHDQYEVSADDAEKKQRRADFAQQFFNSQGQGIVDGSSNISSGSSGSSGNSGGMFGFLGGMMSKITAPIKAGWTKFTGALMKAFENNPAIKKISELMFGGNPFGGSTPKSGGGINLDDLVKSIDAKIAELEEEERREKLKEREANAKLEQKIDKVIEDNKVINDNVSNIINDINRDDVNSEIPTPSPVASEISEIKNTITDDEFFDEFFDE